MRMSQLISRTLREAPGGTQSKGHEYLLRAGYVRQMAAGVFSNLPLGHRTLAKIETIIREEMNAIGGQEMTMPVVNPADIWKETGRWYQIDAEMGRFVDRNARDMVLAMTHEEAVTDVIRGELASYKQLPAMVYHIQTKWRDDPRPRAGLIRVREFVMKDSYTFDKDFEGLEKQYKAHYAAYFRIFGRCGLPTVAVGSDTGMMGGKVAHEYMYLHPIGEDTIIQCPGCGYTANRQVAKFKKEFAKADALGREEVATPGAATIEDLAAFLKIDTRQTAKAVFMVGTFTEGEESSEKLVVAVIRGDLEVEDAKLQNAAKADRLRPAHEEEIRGAGIVPGYGSPIGASDDVVVIVDDSAAESSNLVAGANKEGYHFLNTNYGRDYLGAVADIASAQAGFACPECGEAMTSDRGIEVGNIFQLGTRYSETMGATFQDENGKERPVVMGSYGIGVGRLLACAAEEYSDDKGLKLPISIAPYHVHLVSLMKSGEEHEKLYRELTAAGVEVLFDDRKESPGVKFNDADLIGVPLRVTIGERSIKNGGVEFTHRDGGEQYIVPLEEAVSRVQVVLAKMRSELSEKVEVREL